MKKIGSQISVAIVCCILGFVTASQFRMLSRQNNSIVLSKNSADITVEIEQYKKQKDELDKKVNELQNQLKSYENAAAGRSEVSKELLKELEDTRVLMGSTDVYGEGVIIYLTPNSGFLSNNSVGRIEDKDLANIVNELRFAGAEAISINDIRITGNSGIRTSGNYIIVDGDEKISPTSRVLVKAIGQKNLLYSDLSFPEVFASFKGICDVKFEKSDNIKIGKYNKTFKLNYAKPVK